MLKKIQKGKKKASPKSYFSRITDDRSTNTGADICGF